MQKRNALTTVIVKEKVRRSIQRFLITKPNANSLAAGLGRSFLVCSHMFNKNIHLQGSHGSWTYVPAYMHNFHITFSENSK